MLGRALAAGVSLLLASGFCASNAQALPDQLNVPENSCFQASGRAYGAQIYACQAGENGYAWVFRAPEADLYSDSGEYLAHHYAGPTWESPDGSYVVGSVIARADAPNPEDIAWLLLQASANGGDGLFSRTHFVQRLETYGGQAPADGCDEFHDGEVANVYYEATYVFYTD